MKMDRASIVSAMDIGSVDLTEQMHSRFMFKPKI
jgi:hypothetical protein